MIPMLASTLPEPSNDGYVAAAYIVFFAIVLIYVAIMAVRLGRVERKVEQLRGDAKTGTPPARAGGIADLESPSDPVGETKNEGPPARAGSTADLKDPNAASELPTSQERETV